jgi:hypothetical protein
MDIQTDIKKMVQAVVLLTAFGASKLSKATQAVAIQTTFDNLKAAFKLIDPANPPTKEQLIQAIFKVLSASANLTSNKAVQDLESLAQQIYSIITGNPQGTVDFLTIVADIKALFHGKVSGVPAAPLDAANDAKLLEEGLVVIVAYILAQLPQNAEQTAAEVIAAITAGLDSFDQATAITNEQAMTALFHVLEAIADLSGNHSVLVIEQLFEKIYGIIGGTQGNFVKWFEEIGVLIKAKKEAKALLGK